MFSPYEYVHIDDSTITQNINFAQKILKRQVICTHRSLEFVSAEPENRVAECACTTAFS